MADEENSLGAADRRETFKPKEATVASGRLAQGFPSGGSVRLWGAGLVKVESHEDIAVFALEKAPPTDWPTAFPVCTTFRLVVTMTFPIFLPRSLF